MLGLCTACSSNDVLDPDNPTPITVWTYYSGSQMQAFDSIVEEFNLTRGKEIGVVVEAETKGSIGALMEAINASANKEVGSEQLPNIMSGYLDMAYDLEKKGLLADLDEYFSPKEISEYVDGYIEEGYFGEGNGLKVLPVLKSSEVLVINKTDWDKFANETGISFDTLSTWEGITQTAEKYYNWCGKAFFGRDSDANYLIIGSKQLGAEIFEVTNGELKLNIDKNVMKKLWDNFYVPYIKGHFIKNGKFRSDDAKTGDLIAWVGSTASAVYLPKEVVVDETTSYPMEVVVLPLPNFENTESYAVQQGAGMMVTKSEKVYEYASAEFLKWITDTDVNVEFALNASYAPVKKEANNIENIKAIMKKSNIEISDAVKDTMEVLVKQATTYNMFTSKPFNNASEARNLLGKVLVDKAVKDKEEIDKLISEGKTREEAVNLYNTQENFEKWLENLKTELELVVNK